LGARLQSDIGGVRVTVRLTEVEAYGGPGLDPGSHTFRGRTPRTTVMFGEVGHLYVYFTYGMHWCANVVAHEAGEVGAVLLRAGEVIEGIEVARERRLGSSDRDLARGPARLTRALGMDGAQDGTDLYAEDSLVRLIRPAGQSISEVRIGPRVGVRDLREWRFSLNDPTVSPYRPAKSRR
jgi:DNA-3-methyladenine glycosylase